MKVKAILQYKMIERLIAALFYGLTSLGLILTVKASLTIFKFPEALFLALAQSISTICGLYLAYLLGMVQLNFSVGVFYKVSTVAIVNSLNVGSGLVGTKAISIPMFAALKNLSMPLSMAGEAYILNINISNRVKLSVLLMSFGTLLAAVYDLSLEAFGYTAILISAFCTASYNVLTKLTLEKESDVNKWNMLLYNNFIAIPVYIMGLIYRGTITEVMNFTDWSNPVFCILFATSSVLGIVLQFSILYAIEINGPLALTVTGLLKNILSTYIGVLGLGGDYRFTWLNFLGINVSLMGGILYSKVKYDESNIENIAHRDDDARDIEMNTMSLET